MCSENSHCGPVGCPGSQYGTERQRSRQHDGIVHVNAEKTLENLGILGNWGMKDTNRIILDLMLEKQKI